MANINMEYNDDIALFYNRRDAGRQLAQRLLDYKDQNPVVIGLTKGGDMVGYEVAKALECPFDIIVSERLGAPGHEEFSIGAIAEGGVRVLDKYILQWLGITDGEIQEITSNCMQELIGKINIYREGESMLDITDKTVILIDDSLSTSFSARAAVQALRLHKPKEIILAVPVSAPETALSIRPDVDDFVCLSQPADYIAKGLWYKNLQQITDDQIVELLATSKKGTPSQLLEEFESENAEISKPTDSTVEVSSQGTTLRGTMLIPQNTQGLIVFVNGIGETRFSNENRYIAHRLRQEGFGTLFVDLHTEEEIKTQNFNLDIDSSAQRLIDITDWLHQNPYTSNLMVGFFGVNSGGITAILAAKQLGSEKVAALVIKDTNLEDLKAISSQINIPVFHIASERDQNAMQKSKALIDHITTNQKRTLVVPQASTEFIQPEILDIITESTYTWFSNSMKK
jgi:putative phosphoribosyl transferase